jgi:hypothetical protein
MEWSASSDNSMRLYMSNGSTVQFDGFWERDRANPNPKPKPKPKPKP